jgi:hypothetical protein
VISLSDLAPNSLIAMTISPSSTERVISFILTPLSLILTPHSPYYTFLSISCLSPEEASAKANTFCPEGDRLEDVRASSSSTVHIHL